MALRAQAAHGKLDFEVAVRNLKVSLFAACDQHTLFAFAKTAKSELRCKTLPFARKLAFARGGLASGFKLATGLAAKFAKASFSRYGTFAM